jgi:hypothetical protein
MIFALLEFTSLGLNGSNQRESKLHPEVRTGKPKASKRDSLVAAGGGNGGIGLTRGKFYFLNRTRR